MKRTNLAETEGNPGDQISTLIFRNVEVNGVFGNFKNKYCNVTFEKVKVNGTAFDGQ
ncbi:hypothetical protein [Siphonobacter sp. BAB-5385]|uniref:hypothetical protein n=1 Tax=Siphonobacter sp. BAB-5385 TaxID=1864822 RepID=UPI001594FD1F|nr:hypothetical protein [Siphonobacter sp. BAB-5385]